MISGWVTAEVEAIIELLVAGPAGVTRRIRAVIDTGFNGLLTLLPRQIAALGLTRVGEGTAVLADGTQSSLMFTRPSSSGTAYAGGYG